MRIAVGSDHAGVGLKAEVEQLLKSLNHDYEDFGAYDTRSVDYPDIARLVAGGVASGQFDLGILICGTGVGVSIAANKMKGVRAALCHDTFSARASREHNDANILCLGSRVLGPGLALDIVRTWLEADFSGEDRHVRRVHKIRQLEC